jgi:hypothetical protein
MPVTSMSCGGCALKVITQAAAMHRPLEGKVGPGGWSHGWKREGVAAVQDLAEGDRARGNDALDNFKPVKVATDADAVAYLKRSAPGIPAGNADAVNRYTGDKFFALNKALRSGDASDPDVARIDAAMRPAPDGLILTRHVGADAFGLRDEDLSKV